MPAKKSPKRPGHPGGVSGRNTQPQRLLRAPAELWSLVDQAVADSGDTWSNWARHTLAAEAAKPAINPERLVHHLIMGGSGQPVSVGDLQELLAVYGLTIVSKGSK